MRQIYAQKWVTKYGANKIIRSICAFHIFFTIYSVSILYLCMYVCLVAIPMPVAILVYFLYISSLFCFLSSVPFHTLIDIHPSVKSEKRIADITIILVKTLINSCVVLKHAHFTERMYGIHLQLIVACLTINN